MKSRSARVPAFALIAAALAATLSPAVVSAAAPSEAQMIQLQRLLGFDKLTDQVFAQYFQHSPRLKRYTPEQRTCVTDLVKPALLGQQRRTFGASLGEQARVQEVLEFAQTDVGRKYFMHMRKLQLDPDQPRQPEAAVDRYAQSLPQAEREKLIDFWRSPAAAALGRAQPDMSLPPAMKQKLRQQSLSKCGVEPVPL